MSDEIEEEEDLDFEDIWDGICAVAAGRAGISTEQAKAILAGNGFDAYSHTGIVDAVEVVVLETKNRRGRR